jgi:hypothetical protein
MPLELSSSGGEALEASFLGRCVGEVGDSLCDIPFAEVPLDAECAESVFVPFVGCEPFVLMDKPA